MSLPSAEWSALRQEVRELNLDNVFSFAVVTSVVFFVVLVFVAFTFHSSSVTSFAVVLLRLMAYDIF